MEYKGIKIDWLGHASFRLSNSAIVYIDPFKLEVGQPKADIILITHSHYDHCSLADIQRLLKPDTVVVGPVDTQSKVAKLAGNVDFRMVHPGEQVNVKGISISTLPAYNINKPYHPKENGWVGYLIEVSGVRV
ncbi:MBL fold metallo-hydrolase, partial [Candidatus Woesearchaeota archaeon]|nr:MBL fold metallo-hydrolase [Candidatus Woesearchaeota archaeon]